MNEHLQQQALLWASITGSLMGAIESALIDLKYNATKQAVEKLRDVLRRANETRESMS